MRAKWLNAWGVFPSCLFVWGSHSSLRSLTSLRRLRSLRTGRQPRPFVRRPGGRSRATPAQGTPRADAIPVSKVMLAVPDGVAESATLQDAALALARSGQGVLPVLDATGAYRGTVSSRSVADALADGAHDDTPASEVTELPPELKATDLLDAGLEVLDISGGSAVPVLDSQAHEVVGWFTHRAALTALRADVAPRPQTTPGEVRSS